MTDACTYSTKTSKANLNSSDKTVTSGAPSLLPWLLRALHWMGPLLQTQHRHAGAIITSKQWDGQAQAGPLW